MEKKGGLLYKITAEGGRKTFTTCRQSPYTYKGEVVDIIEMKSPGGKFQLSGENFPKDNIIL